MKELSKRSWFSKGFGRRILSGLLVLAMVVTMSPVMPGAVKEVSAASNYNAQGAISYARAHWNDGVGLCAQFVSTCLHAGGLPYDTYWNPHTSIDPKTGYNNWTTTSLKDYLIYKGYKVIWNPSLNQILPGNPVFYSKRADYARSHNGTQHTAICVSNANGNNPLVCAHNNAHIDYPHTWMMSSYRGCCTILINDRNVPPVITDPPVPVDYNNPDTHPFPTRVLRTGYSGNDVRWVQAICNRRLNTGLSVDGQFGAQTKNAVMAFQRTYGLTVDGIVGKQTSSKMKEWWDSTKTVNPVSVSIGGGSGNLTVGYSMQLSANVQPGNATNKNVTWSSSNNGVATVSNGTVRGVKEGNVTITASTHNGKRATKTISVHKPCIVRFVNDDGTLISEQSVAYGGSAKAPTAPTKVGHTFTGWNGKYQGVTSASMVTATFTRNKYKVDFKESNGKKIIETQSVFYEEAATAPKEEDLTIPDGYKFNGWSDEFDHISSNLTVYPVYKWADDELPMVVSAEENACKADYDEGIYSLSFTVKNHFEKARNVKIMTYMSTKEGKLVAQGETRTIRVPGAKNDVDGSKEVDDMVVTCKAAADKVRILVLDDYESAVPLAEIKDIDVEAAGYGKWTDRTPTPSDEAPLSRDVYRCKNVSYTTSSNATMDGWTKYDSSTSYKYGGWVYAGTGTNIRSNDTTKSEYIPPNPDPNGGSENWMAAFNSVSVIRKGQAGAQVAALQALLINCGYSTTHDGSFGSGTEATVKSFQAANGLTADGLAGSQTKSALVNKYNAIHRYKYYTRSKSTVYTYKFYKVDADWSDWSAEKPNGDTTLKAGTTKVLYETGKQYRYKEFKTDNAGTKMTPSFTLPEDAMGLAGKNAVAIVYKHKVSQISEDNVEYIGDTKIGTDGKIDLSFVPREEQTYNGTGDYTVAIGVKGTTNYINVGKIEAEKPVHKVVFNYNVADVTKQWTKEVKDGEAAPAPEVGDLVSTVDFTGWDKDFSNVTADMVVNATWKYKVNKVTFIDWENRTVENKSVEVTGTCSKPDAPNAPEGKVFKGWKPAADYGEAASSSDEASDAIAENIALTGKYIGDMLYEAVFEDKTCEVTFVDNAGKVVDKQFVKMGGSAIEPIVSDEVTETVVADEKKMTDGVVPENIGDLKFVSWGEEVDLSNITTNLTVGAIYQYDETVEMPKASVKTGEYDTAQTVELSTETKDAIIYYTLDGSDPGDVTNENVKIYSGPIAVSDKTKLKFYATKLGMNDSPVVEEWYSINTAGNTPTHVINIMAINVFDNTPVGDYKAFIKDGSKVDLSQVLVDDYVSVVLDKIYYDEELSDEWKAASETVTESLTLYAVYDAKKYAVTYLDEAGQKITEKMVKYGTSAQDKSIAPEKDGYQFALWELDPSAENMVGSENIDSVTKEMTVRAKYVKKEDYKTLSFARKSYSIMAGSSYAINPKVKYQATGETADNETIKWTSSDETVAIVDENGTVNALRKGTVTIKATLLSNGESAECTVKVTGNPEVSICLFSNSNYRLENGILRNISLEKNLVSDVMKQIDSDSLVFYDRNNEALSNDKKVGTGTRIRMNDATGKTMDEVSIVITGDYTGDGKITNKDVSGVLRSLLNKETPDELQMAAIDVNGDGYVNNRDAAMLGRYLVGKEELE